MVDFQNSVQRYLSSLFSAPVAILSIRPVGEVVSRNSIKSYGYGKPLRVDYQLPGDPPQSAILHTSRPGPFGHEHMADRAQNLIWSHQAFGRLPRHAHSLDVGAFRRNGEIVSLGDADEFCLLSEYVEGEGYNVDLERIRDTDLLTHLDLARADALCHYLVDIHRIPGGEPGLYTRRIRELVGHGECIMGLTDSYPPHPLIPATLLEEIEHLSVNWRWKLKPLTHRLRQVHGDFHPWNILFGQGDVFHVLDRSRGEWGDPADDIVSLTANYLFFSLRRFERLEGIWDTLFQRFWRNYLSQSGDAEMLRVAAPFFAFRGLVLASPVWYPALPDVVRQKLLAFVLSVLRQDEFDPSEVNGYCAG